MICRVMKIISYAINVNQDITFKNINVIKELLKIVKFMKIKIFVKNA
jgi:hypothetical protein